MPNGFLQKDWQLVELQGKSTTYLRSKRPTQYINLQK